MNTKLITLFQQVILTVLELKMEIQKSSLTNHFLYITFYLPAFILFIRITIATWSVSCSESDWGKEVQNIFLGHSGNKVFYLDYCLCCASCFLIYSYTEKHGMFLFLI